MKKKIDIRVITLVVIIVGFFIEMVLKIFMTLILASKSSQYIEHSEKSRLPEKNLYDNVSLLYSTKAEGKSLMLGNVIFDYSKSDPVAGKSCNDIFFALTNLTSSSYQGYEYTAKRLDDGNCLFMKASQSDVLAAWSYNAFENILVAQNITDGEILIDEDSFSSDVLDKNDELTKPELNALKKRGYTPEVLQKKTSIQLKDWMEIEVNALIKVLKNNILLEDLKLHVSDFGDEQAEALANNLSYHQTLLSLSLVDNDIADQGARAFAKLLYKNDILVSLSLADNYIGDQGAKFLAESLGVNKTLTSLSLSQNNIDDLGAETLAQALGENKHLTSLFLADNYIGDSGAKALAEALVTNNTLTTLSLSENNIDDEGAEALAEALMKNNTLIYFDFSDNIMSDAGENALKVALANRQVS